MFNRFLLSSLFILGIVVSSFAQNATIRGFVYNKKNGEPVIFTNVFLVGTSLGAQTDVNGFYSITKIPAGSYTISITAIGFDPLEQQVTVTAGQLLNKNLTISEKEIRLKEFEITSEKENEQSRVGTSVTTLSLITHLTLPTILRVYVRGVDLTFTIK